MTGCLAAIQQVLLGENGIDETREEGAREGVEDEMVGHGMKPKLLIPNGERNLSSLFVTSPLYVQTD